MEFSNKELIVIYSTLDVCVACLEMKKKHKTKNDILSIEKMKKILNKIDNYKEEKQNAISN